MNGSAGESVSTDAEPPLPRDERIARQLAETSWISTLTTRPAGHPIGCLSAARHRRDVRPRHGYRLGCKSPARRRHPQRSSNVLAVAAPGHVGVLPEGTTPVNVLVRILDAYGLATLPFQPDTTWAYKGPSDILDMVQVDPVTGLVR